MKITKKQPLRPRGRSEEKRQSTKNAIRDAYINGPQKEVQIIPAKRDMETETEKKKLRVCAYCRVSTDEDTQASSYELQVQNYTRMIQENPEWEFAGIFADEGISGTSVLHREHFLEMIEKCKAGEIDLIITKQVSRFARNVLDSLNYIFMLRKLDPPVGVYFETEKLNTLDTTLCPWRMSKVVECTSRYWRKRRCRPLAKVDMKMPEDFLLKISRLGSNFDSVADTVLQAGGEVVLKKVKSNLSSVIGRGTKFKSRTTGELEGALGLSPSKLNRDGNHDIKVGFAEPRSDGGSNAKLANILEYGKHGQPAKPFLKPAKTASRQECIDAMTKALDEEVEKL